MMTAEIASEIPTSDLYKETVKLLQNRPRTLSISYISEQTGLNFSWLDKLVNAKIKDPSVNRIEHLNKFLKNYVASI